MKKFLFLLALTISTSALFAKGVTAMQLFPADFQRGNFPVTENYPYRIIVKFKGEAWKLKKNQAKFVFELPSYISAVRVCTRLVPQKDIPFSTEKISRNGKDITRYILDIPYNKLNISPKSYIWRCGFDLYIEAGKGSAGQRWTMPLYFDVNGEKVCEKSIFLSILPEIPADRKRLEKFRFSIKELPSAGHPDTSLLRKQIEMWKSFSGKQFMAFGWEQFNYPESSMKLLNEHVEFFYYTHASDHSTMILQNSGTDDLGFYVANKVTRPGVPLYHDAKGKIHTGAICPQYLMRDPEGLFYGEYLRRAIEKAKKYSPGIKSFVIDYEPIAGGGTCPECMKDFAKFAKLKNIPVRKDIQQGKPLQRSWQLYKIHQNKIIMAKIADGVKKHFPDMKFSFCSTELRPSADVINTWDAVDVGAMESKTDFYSFMIYSTGLTYYNHLAYAAQNLTTAKSFPWIDPSEEIERFFNRYSPEKVQQNIVASMALNADGLMIYPTDTLDGRYMTIFAETGNVLAQVEDIYYGRNLTAKLKYAVLNTAKIKIIDEKGNLKIAEYPDLQSQVKAHLHEKDGVYLISILNYADEKAIAEIAIPDYQGGSVTGSDLINKRNYTDLSAENIRRGFAVEIPSNGCAVIKLGGKAGNFAGVSQLKMREYGKKSAESGKNIPATAMSKGNAAIQWRIFKKNVMLTLINGENYVTVNPGNNGRIEEWSAGWHIPTGRPSGTLGEVIFYDSSQSEKREYSIEKSDLSGNIPALLLKSEIQADTNAGGGANPLAGLIMEKRISLALDGTIEITDTFTNPTAKDMTLGFRIKHLPFSAYKPGTKMEISLDGKNLLPGIYLKKGMDLNWYAAAGAAELKSDTRFTLKAGSYNYRFDFPKASGLYFWRNQICHTAESLYAPIILKPGEKHQVTEKISFSAK
ncbi:MAG: hypothetical protein J6W00_06995 [Lentisphaeria bacterium]|nr:hypothetical protein [Lentisphaeria bacterium]